MAKGSIAAVILSGGRSSRFGAPKILQNFCGENFLRRILRGLFHAGADPVLLVLGHGAEHIRRQLPVVSGLKIVVNPRPQFGQFSSLQVGVREIATLNPEIRGAILCLVDQPHIRGETYRWLLGRAQENPDCVIIPTFSGRGGHPIYLPAVLFPAILEAAPEDNLRQLLLQHRELVLREECTDPGILEDIDEPADLRRLEKLCNSLTN